jgi:hypothetical protein
MFIVCAVWITKDSGLCGDSMSATFLCIELSWAACGVGSYEPASHGDPAQKGLTRKKYKGELNTAMHGRHPYHQIFPPGIRIPGPSPANASDRIARADCPLVDSFLVHINPHYIALRR